MHDGFEEQDRHLLRASVSKQDEGLMLLRANLTTAQNVEAMLKATLEIVNRSSTNMMSANVPTHR